MSAKKGPVTPTKVGSSAKRGGTGAVTPKVTKATGQQDLDIAGLNLGEKEKEMEPEELPKVMMAKEKLLEEVKRSIEARDSGDKQAISLIVVGKKNIPSIQRV
jgi:elongation factor 1 alpha-like protein